MRTSTTPKSIRVFGLVVAATLATLGLMQGLASATASSAQACLTHASAHASITISGGRATAHFTLPKNCKNQVVSLVSYTAPNGTDHKPFAEQKLFKATTRTFNISGSRTMSVAVPDCFFQVDLARGEPIQFFANTTYSAEGRLLTASGGGNKPCNLPPPAQPSTTTPPQPQTTAIINNNTNTNINTVNADRERPAAPRKVAAQAVAPAPAPKSGKLADTGPGEVAALSFGTTMTGGLLFAYRRRYDSILAGIVSRF